MRFELCSLGHRLFVVQTLAANQAQIASKCRRKQRQEQDDAVFEALWTESLNAKRLGERRALAATLKKTEEIKAALLEQVPWLATPLVSPTSSFRAVPHD